MGAIFDFDDIMLMKREVVGRHDAGAGQQYGTIWK